MDKERIKHSLAVADKMIELNNGQDVGFEKRLEDIQKRYGKESEEYIKASNLIKRLGNEV